MQRPTLGVWRCQRAAGAALVVASALAFALDGPVARAAYQQGLDPAAFGFSRALAGAVVLGGFMVTRPRSGVLASIRRMRRPASSGWCWRPWPDWALTWRCSRPSPGYRWPSRWPCSAATAAGRGLKGRLATACGGVIGPGMGMCLATVAVIGLVLLIRPDPLVSVPAAGLLLALLAAVLHAAYILLGRDGWGEIGDGAATFLIVATAAAGLGALTAVTRSATVLVPVTDLRLTTLLLLEGALAGAAAPLLFLAGLRRIGATQTAVLSLCEPLAATLLAAVMLGQQPAPAQLLGAALLVGAGIAVQAAPASRDRGDPPDRTAAAGRSLGSITEAATAETKVGQCQRTAVFVDTLRRLGYTEAAEEAARKLPDPVSVEEIRRFPTGTTCPATR